MAELNLPEGYSSERVEFTYVRNKKRKLILALPTEKCTPERVEEVIRQTEAITKRTEP